MAKMYRPSDIEPKWQERWAKNEVYKTESVSGKPKYYCLDFFPYPSGYGLHVGHLEGYVATDVLSRYMRAKGFNVLHPMGWDALGLPAENFAIKQKSHPDVVTQKSVDMFKEQARRAALSYDWGREIDSSKPDYYKWTQWFFLLLYKKGLAYRKEAPVNWCPSCQTVLANEQVVKADDKNTCERCGTEVIQKNLEQWFFKITDYADRLLDDLDKIDWPQSTKMGQKNWIGRQEGVVIDWPVVGLGKTVSTFTKYPETVFGATYISLAPEHALVKALTTTDNESAVTKYLEFAKSKTELQRTDLNKEKTGVFTGSFVLNRVNGEKIPVWVADYVLPNYGTGAVFGVPAHDARDFAFAQAHKLPIKRVIKDRGGDTSEVVKPAQVTEDGTMINSDFLNGLDAQKQAKQKIADYFEDEKWGKRHVFYHLRDWLVSRQRYWGAPIPVIYCSKCVATGKFLTTVHDGTNYAIVTVPEDQLPVLLPTDVDFKPTGESPLVYSKAFHAAACPNCGSKEGVKRESDTMDTFVDSSWYYFRFTDPHNAHEFASKKTIEQFCPVDLYMGGAEHTVLHLMYARFFTKVLFDEGYISFDEPFSKLRHQGMILGEDSRKMSKRWGNVINPDDVIDAFGADTMRTYEMFMGPIDVSKAWSTSGVEGVKRFYNRSWELALGVIDSGRQESSAEATREINLLIKKVGEDIEELKFNTAVSSMMEFVNFWHKNKEAVGLDTVKNFVQVMAPFAPHMAEELWEMLGQKFSVTLAEWPKFDAAKIVQDTFEIPVSINGKVRAHLSIDKSKVSDQEYVIQQARDAENVRKLIADKEIKKVIYAVGKIVNIATS